MNSGSLKTIPLGLVRFKNAVQIHRDAVLDAFKRGVPVQRFCPVERTWVRHGSSVFCPETPYRIDPEHYSLYLLLPPGARVAWDKDGQADEDVDTPMATLAQLSCPSDFNPWDEEDVEETQAMMACLTHWNSIP
jgi:hypothetical protein